MKNIFIIQTTFIVKEQIIECDVFNKAYTIKEDAIKRLEEGIAILTHMEEEDFTLTINNDSTQFILTNIITNTVSKFYIINLDIV